MTFNPEYPIIEEQFTSCANEAKSRKERGIAQIHTPCGGGIDDHEHRVYCGCAGDGWWTVEPKKDSVSNEDKVKKFVDLLCEEDTQDKYALVPVMSSQKDGMLAVLWKNRKYDTRLSLYGKDDEIELIEDLENCLAEVIDQDKFIELEKMLYK